MDARDGGKEIEEKATVTRRAEAHVLPLLEAGLIRVPLAQTYTLEDAPSAYERFAQGGKLGKIVLSMGD